MFSQKARHWILGRKNQIVEQEQEKTIWIHAASVGEFEQALPLMRALKNRSAQKIIVSFFSPSGYLNKKDHPLIDKAYYLPLDSEKKSANFIERINPSMAFFVKYEIWPFYFLALSKRGVPLFLISAIFREGQFYFKPWARFFQKAMQGVTHYFVQNELSKQLLNSIDIDQVSLCGDTRIDRVLQIAKEPFQDAQIELFVAQHKVFVLGSVWADDLKVMRPFIRAHAEFKYIIASHQIEHTAALQDSLDLKSVCLSELEQEKEPSKLSDVSVLFIDSIGMLSKLYRYADLVYVGGGFKTGLHNTLEPAVYGKPIVIGPKYDKFQEAKDLVELEVVQSVVSSNAFEKAALKGVREADYIKKVQQNSQDYFKKKVGAVHQIMKHIIPFLNHEYEASLT